MYDMIIYMLSVLFLILTILSCYVIVRRLGEKVFRSGAEMLAVSVPMAIATTGLLSSAGAVFLPQGISTWVAIAVLVFIAGVCFRSARPLWPAWPVGEFSVGSKVWYAGLILVLGGFMVFLVISTVQPGADSGSIQIPEKESGDIVYHLSQILRVGGTENWNFEEPSYAGEFIRYPFLINAFSGYLLRLGAPLVFAYHLPMIMLIIPLLFGLMLLCRQLGLGKVHTILVIAGAFFGSGMAYLLGYDFNAGAAGVAYPHQHVNYIGLIAGYYVNQRAFALGMTLLMFSLVAFFRGLKDDDINGFKWAGFLFGLLPLAHAHTFIAGAVFYGIVLLYYIVRYFARGDMLFYGLVRGVLFYGVFTAIVPVICMFLLPKEVLGGVPAFRLGWMSDPNGVGGLKLPSPEASKLGPWLTYALYNFGSLLLLPLLIFSGFKKKMGEVFWLVAITALAFWVVPNLIQFQIWDYDNNKLFVYAVMFSAIAAALAVKSLKLRPVRTGAMVLLFASVIGALYIPSLKLRYMVTQDFHDTLTMFSPEEQNAISWVKKNTTEDAAFITSAVIPHRETLLNSVVIGSSRRATIGYVLWLYTHGIDCTERLNKVEKFLSDGDRSHLDGLPADYLLVDRFLRAKYPDLEKTLGGTGLNQAYQSQAAEGSDYSSRLSIYKLK